MKSWKNKLAVLVTLGLSAFSSNEKALAAGNKYTIALIPGLTTDAFYITMRKGAEAAAKALGVDLVFQGAADFNPVTQVGA
jgi:ribose transport system substrate-binding protein